MTIPKIKIVDRSRRIPLCVVNMKEAEKLLSDLERVAFGIEGQILFTYNQLQWFVSQEEYKERKVLTVMLVPLVSGG